MKKYRVEMFYNWHTGIEVEAETPEEAEEKANETPWEKIVEDFDTDDLEYDNHEVYGGDK